MIFYLNSNQYLEKERRDVKFNTPSDFLEFRYHFCITPQVLADKS